MSAPAATSPALSIEKVGPAVVLTVDRPATRNSIDGPLAQAIGAAVRAASADPEVRGVVLTAAGDRVFLSGGDLNMLVNLAVDPSGAEAVLGLFDELSACEACEVPVIAAVQGDVFGGGCELALLCDLMIVEAHASFAFRHAKMGLSPAWGGLNRLLERVGPIEAARLLYMAERVPAAEALRIGLVNEVVPSGSARARALAIVDRIAENPRASVAGLKRGLVRVREARRAEAAVREREAFAERWGGAEHLAAMDAFRARK